MARLVQVRTLRSASEFLAHLDTIGVALPFAEPVTRDGPLAQPIAIGTRRASNRFAILPMEGWDATPDGQPTDLVQRRWDRFGSSGAGLVWGEAVAVRADGRANPRQLVISPAVAGLRGAIPESTVTGLQLTHSGRWARPEGEPRPRTAYVHPWLDARVGAGPSSVLRDDELDELVDCFVSAAVIAQDAGFDFVDIKHCHGYLLHELLSARTRPGRYGGSLDKRMAFLRAVVSGIQRRAPGLATAVRVSAFDLAPFRDGEPETREYEFAFGGDGSGTGVDLTEPAAFLAECVRLGVSLVCITAGSPYYCPHAQRPAYFPPTDGYPPPRDPLVDVAQLVDVTARLKRAIPELIVVGSGYSYLQEWLPNVAQAAVESGATDVVGIGRLALSYPDLPRVVLAGDTLERRYVCRTFSDCTSAPRNGLVSGCYPLDPFYKAMPERAVLARAKRA